MAYLLAKSQGWPQDRLQFIVQKDFRTMRRGVGEVGQNCNSSSGNSSCGGNGNSSSSSENESADLLMWEWYMTKPFVDAMELKALGYFDTPWHCFSFIARKDWLDEVANRELLQRASSLVFSLCREMMEKEDSSCEEISAHFGIDLIDAHSWFNKVRYAQELVMPNAMVERVLEALASVGVIPPVLTKTSSSTTSNTEKNNVGVKSSSECDKNDGIVYDIQDIVDTRIARLLYTDEKKCSSTASQFTGKNDHIVEEEEEAYEEWERNVPMVSSRVNISSQISLLSSNGGGGADSGERGTMLSMTMPSSSEISLSLNLDSIGRIDDLNQQQQQTHREVFLSTLSPGDSIIGAAHIRVKRDAAIGEAYERRASFERRASLGSSGGGGGGGGGGGDFQLRKSFVGVVETKADNEEENDNGEEEDVENIEDIEDLDEGDTQKSKGERIKLKSALSLSSSSPIRSALPLPSSSSSFSPSVASSSSSFTSFSPPQIRMPTKDSLVPTAGTTEYTLWKGKKRAALEAVLGHLDSFGGQATNTGRVGGNNGYRRDDNMTAGAESLLTSSSSSSTSTIVTPAQAVIVTRLNWITSGAAVDIG
jgi:hypothetical protein